MKTQPPELKKFMDKKLSGKPFRSKSWEDEVQEAMKQSIQRKSKEHMFQKYMDLHVTGK